MINNKSELSFYFQQTRRKTMHNYLKKTIATLMVFHSTTLFAMEHDKETRELSKKSFRISEPPSSRLTAKGGNSALIPSDDLIINLLCYNTALQQEEGKQHDLANYNYHLAFGERTDKDFHSSSSEKDKKSELHSTILSYKYQDKDIEALELSNKSLLISEVPYSEKAKGNGALTLCFKKVKEGTIFEYEHAALVFEMVFEPDPHNIYTTMIHYGGETCCWCFGKDMKPLIEDELSTLNKVYRGMTYDRTTGEKKFEEAEYKRHFSWILPNENLIKGYNLAVSDEKEHRSNPPFFTYSCITYVERIMSEVGISNLDFGAKIHRAENLKLVIIEDAQPKPDRTVYTRIPLPKPTMPKSMGSNSKNSTPKKEDV